MSTPKRVRRTRKAGQPGMPPDADQTRNLAVRSQRGTLAAAEAARLIAGVSRLIAERDTAIANERAVLALHESIQRGGLDTVADALDKYMREARDVCPQCPYGPLIPRSQMADHIGQEHSGTETPDRA